MLVLIVIVIMLGFHTAFTLMGLGMFFGFIAFHSPGQAWSDSKIFDLMVQRTYGVMTNDTLISLPLFVFMGYVMERAALVDKMFYSVQLAMKRVPASLAVTTLIVCTFWGIASGIVGAVVILVGVIALRPMLNAGYDVRLASGVITAGGTLGILIPPSIMIIVYAAVAGQSVVKLYAAAMLPGFFLSFLYLVYIVGWALINPKIAPKLKEEDYHVAVPPWVAQLQQNHGRNVFVALAKALIAPARILSSASGAAIKLSYLALLRNFAAAAVPLLMVLGSAGGAWWFFVIHQEAPAAQATPAVVSAAKVTPAPVTQEPEEPQEMGINARRSEPAAAEKEPEEPQALGGGREVAGATSEAPPPADSGDFYLYFWIGLAIALLWTVRYYRRMEGEQFVILKLLLESVVPLGVLTVLVLAVILFGITTATESAAIGAVGALLLAVQAKTLTFERIKESVFLTAKTTSMVCWLFVGSALFSAVFAVLGGQQLVEKWVLALDLSPLQFMLLAQVIIFFLGWPLEWTEIIVIFVPIFIPLLPHFQVDPILFGTMVAVNLQAAFLSPPVAMSAFYLKGVAPSHVTLNQIFAGMMPYMLIVIVCMVIMYVWPGMTLWLPKYLYGG
ncbi:MAG TPA: TRAP transporter large permease subunit [Polaromonas sp.]